MIKSFKRLRKEEKEFLYFGLLLLGFLPLVQAHPQSSQGIGQGVTLLYSSLVTASFWIGAKPFLKNLFKTR